MRRAPRLFRLTAGVALSALLLDSVAPRNAIAQPAPPPLPPLTGSQPDTSQPGASQPAGMPQPIVSQPGDTQPDTAQENPPERVGRIAATSGTVSFMNRGDTEWSTASPNYPVSTGNSFWTEPSATARLEVSDSRLALAGGTELQVSELNQAGMQAVIAQGEVYLHLRNLAPDESWSLQTPRGTVRLATAGRYDIVVGSTEQPTQVTVLEGSAGIEGPGISLQVAANQTATISGSDPFQGVIGSVVRTAFLNAQLRAEQPPPPPPAAFPQEVTMMPGGSDLLATGSWSEAPDYGEVWYPPVSSGWVPYREGHWAYVAPWGWTWVDNAPWGFAPFHYGRWVEVGGRWGWTPGAVPDAAPPVYAPALVAFIGLGAGVALGAALASHSIGWVPLGPREPYHPWYHASPTYVRQINVSQVTNVRTVNNNVTINNFINRGAATSIPAAVMTGSQPVAAAARPIPPQAFASARPIIGQQPIRPAATTAGITPVVARQLNLGPVPMTHPAPGPAIRAQQTPFAGTGTPGFRPPVPGGAAAMHPGAQTVPALGQAPGGVPAAGLPHGPAGQAGVNEPFRPGGAFVPGRPGVPPVPVAGSRPAGVPQPPAAGIHVVEPGQHPVGAHPPGAHPPGAQPFGAHPFGTPRPEGRPEIPGSGPRPTGAPPPNHPQSAPFGAPNTGLPSHPPEVARPTVVAPRAPQVAPVPQPAPSFHPAPAPEVRPTPTFHPAQMIERPAAPAPHPMPQMMPHPMPQAMPRPMPQPAMRAAPPPGGHPTRPGEHP